MKIGYYFYSAILIVVVATIVLFEPLESKLRDKLRSYKKIDNYF